MIDSREQPLPILRCPSCSTLYGPNMKECSGCGGPLVPAPGPKRLPDVPFVTRDLPARTYKPDRAFPLPSPNKVDL